MKLVIGLVVLLAAAALAAYSLSDPIKARVNEVARQNFEWTPENQQKYPVEFIRYAIDDLQKRQAGFEASKLAVRQLQESTARKLEANQSLADRYTISLRDLKAKYRDAAAGEKKWSADVKGVDVSQQELQELVVQTDLRISRANEYQRALQINAKKLEPELSRAQRAVDTMKIAREDLSQKIELVKLKKRLEELRTLLDDADKIYTDAKIVAEENGSAPSFEPEDLIETNLSTQTARRFEEIMLQE